MPVITISLFTLPDQYFGAHDHGEGGIAAGVQGATGQVLSAVHAGTISRMGMKLGTVSVAPC